MRHELIANFGMGGFMSYSIGIIVGAIVYAHSQWWIILIALVFGLILTMSAIAYLIDETETFIDYRMGLVSKEEAKDAITYIDHTSRGKNDKAYYFVADTHPSKALEIAHAYRTPTAQRFERWAIGQLIKKGESIRPVDNVFEAPEDGVILVFHKGSAW